MAHRTTCKLSHTGLAQRMALLHTVPLSFCAAVAVAVAVLWLMVPNEYNLKQVGSELAAAQGAAIVTSSFQLSKRGQKKTCNPTPSGCCTLTQP